MPTTATRPTTFAWPARRASMHAGIEQPPRYLSRGHGTEQEPDTIVTDWDDVGAGRGCIEDCTDHGDLGDGGHRMPAPSTGWVLLIGVALIAAVGSCALLAYALAAT